MTKQITEADVEAMFQRIQHKLDNQSRKQARKVIRQVLIAAKEEKEQILLDTLL